VGKSKSIKGLSGDVFVKSEVVFFSKWSEVFDSEVYLEGVGEVVCVTE
jgi:hypothetical protein